MSNRNITDAQFEALLLGFSVPEMDTYHGAKWQDYSDIVVVRENPEAFEDGLDLKKDVIMIFTADTNSDYNNDRHRYEERVALLNEKYGTIAYTLDELDTLETRAYGLIGYRFTAWGNVTTTSFVDKQPITETINISATVAEEDAQIRLNLGL